MIECSMKVENAYIELLYKVQTFLYRFKDYFYFLSGLLVYALNIMLLNFLHYSFNNSWTKGMQKYYDVSMNIIVRLNNHMTNYKPHKLRWKFSVSMFHLDDAGVFFSKSLQIQSSGYHVVEESCGWFQQPFVPQPDPRTE